MIGASDLRMNLLVGDEVTHFTNVPCVEEVPEGDSLLSPTLLVSLSRGGHGRWYSYL